MKKNLLILAAALPMVIMPNLSQAEPELIAADVEVTSYLSEIVVELKTSEVKSGTETYIKKDGSCYQVEYVLHEIQKVETPNGTIDLPVTSEIERDISCPTALVIK